VKVENIVLAPIRANTTKLTPKYWPHQHSGLKDLTSLIVMNIITVFLTLILTKVVQVGWLVGRLIYPFSTKIGYIRDKVCSTGLRMANDTVTSRPHCLFVQL